MSLTATSSSTASPSAAAPQQSGTGALEAQKAQCERQLADWVHCVSASTPEGKAKIAEYSTKLASINAQIQQADQAQAQQKSAASQPAPAPPAPPARAKPLSSLGSIIDTYA